jgi:5-methylcytosine-specific restriction endonuclease McrBC GTP-binding regulatory subunit McrB
MKENLKTYVNRANKLKHRLKNLHKHINQVNELNNELKRLTKIIKSKVEREKYYRN